MRAIFFYLGMACYGVAGLAVFGLSWQYVAMHAGFGVAIAGLFVFPALISIVPLYAGFADGDWSMVVLGLGGTVLGGIFAGILGGADGD